MIDITKDFPIYSSLNKWERKIVNVIHKEYPMDVDKIAEIFLTLDKNESATRIRVKRECMYGYNIYKR